MTSLLLIGGGGHCRACIDVIEAEGRFKIAGIVQPVSAEQAPVMGYRWLGTDDDLPTLLSEQPNAIVTVGQIKSPETRIRLYNLLKRHNGHLPIIKSPFAYCSEHGLVGEGTILMHGSMVNANARIGANCIINSQALIEHDAVIGDHCHVSTGARINGDVKIGQGCFIGSGAILKEGIEIGSGAVIGAGRVVMGDVEAGKILGGHVD